MPYIPCPKIKWSNTVSILVLDFATEYNMGLGRQFKPNIFPKNNTILVNQYAASIMNLQNDDIIIISIDLNSDIFSMPLLSSFINYAQSLNISTADIIEMITIASNCMNKVI